MENMDVDYHLAGSLPEFPGFTGNLKQLQDFMSDVTLSLLKILDMSSYTVKGTTQTRLATQPEMKPHEYPHLVKMVRIDGILNLKNFNITCIPLRCLQILDILNLQQLEIISHPVAWLTFPELKALKIGTFGVPLDSLGRPAPPYTYVVHAMSFLRRVEFPKLMSFSLNCPYLPGLERAWVDCLLQFLTKHQKNLRHLVLYFTAVTEPVSGPAPVDTWTHVPAYAERLRALALNLYHYFVYFTQGGPGPDLAALLEYIGVTSTFLRSCVTLYQGLPLYLKGQFLQNNSMSLVKLTLNLDPSKPMNCRDLTSYRALQCLVLVGPPKTKDHYKTENYQGIPASSELKNLRELPKSLRYLQIVNLFLETSELIGLETLLPRLERLSLLGIGEKEDLGMTLEIFCKLIFRKDMLEVGVYRGFNKKQAKMDRTPGSGSPVGFAFAGLALMGAAKDARSRFSYDSIAAYSRNNAEPGNINGFFLMDCRKLRLTPSLIMSPLPYEDYDFRLHFGIPEIEGHTIFID